MPRSKRTREHPRKYCPGAPEYCPMSRPWVGGPFQPRDRSPPSSCRYINSGAIIGVCAFSQGPLDPTAAPLSYSFHLSRPRCPLAPAYRCWPPSASPLILLLPLLRHLFLLRVRRSVLSFSLAMPRRSCPVCFSSRRLPFAKRTLNYVADDKYLSRPLHERPTRTVVRPVLPPLARH